MEHNIGTQKPRIGVYVCKCGINIAHTVDVPAVADYAASLPGVAVARHYLYMCSRPGQTLIQEDIVSGRINRVVVASCTPKMHEPTFRATCQESGLNPYFFEQANIREQCAWVHPPGRMATDKAKELVRMAVQRVALHTPLAARSVTVQGQALVIGGGVAGLTAALAIANAGFPTTLVEKSPFLGGHAARWFRTFPTLERVDDLLTPLLKRAENHHNINILLNSEVVDVDGYIGNFTATVRTNGEISAVPAGTIIVAIGFNPFEPISKPELGFNKYLRVMTTVEVEKLLRQEPEALDGVHDVIFVSCVGSRDKQVGNPYCSRVCCMINAKQAHLLRQRLPDARITVLYTDVRAYGKGFEELYDQVRSEGVLYRRGAVSEIVRHGERVLVRTEDTLLSRPLELEADLVVLGVGMVPRPEHESISRLLKLARSGDGFFMEKHPKLGPVDTSVDGVFLAGSCQSPKDIAETINHARAAAAAALVPMIQEEVQVESAVSNVTPEMCAACGLCVATCPYGALAIDPRAGAVRVNTALCKSCGACSNICPSKTIQIQHFTPAQILAQLNAALVAPEEEQVLAPVG